jgi:glycosyltransferase involved in cell wall biosynthesis
MSLALKNKRSYYIVQNNDDFKQIINENFTIKEHIFLIKGSGVCLKEFSYQDPVKKDILRVLLPARMLLDKGIKEFCNAALILKDKFSNKAEFILTGDLDLINGAGISKKKLLKLLDEPYLIWSGYSNNIKEQLCYADVVVLPSYREGLPKSLIDACAVGRPIITTDAIGCKECVIEGYNGYLVPVGDAQTLADKIEILLNDEQLRIEMGKNARKFAEENFDINDVVNKHLEIYETILKKQQ